MNRSKRLTIIKEEDHAYFEKAVESYRDYTGTKEVICPACGVNINPESSIEFLAENRIIKVSCKKCSTEAMYEVKGFKMVDKTDQENKGKEGMMDTFSLINKHKGLFRFLATHLLSYTIQKNYILFGHFIHLLESPDDKKPGEKVEGELKEIHSFLSKDSKEESVATEFSKFVNNNEAKAEIIFAICVKVVHLEASSLQDIVATKVFSIEKVLLRKICEEMNTNYSELLRQTINLIITDKSFRNHLIKKLYPEDKPEIKKTNN